MMDINKYIDGFIKMIDMWYKEGYLYYALGVLIIVGIYALFFS